MKKLLILLITSFTFIGCSEHNPVIKDEPLIVTSIASWEDKFKYFATTRRKYQQIYFIDTVGAYSIGDTITFKK